MARPAPADCALCRSYYVTHDPQWRHGCRAFSMRSRRKPCIEVLESSGRACQAFEPREQDAPGPAPRDARERGWLA